MTTQPESLRLVDLLEQIDGQYWQVQDSAAAELRRLHAQIAACEPYLKEGETPAERIERDHRDSLALMTLLAREKTKNEALLEALKSTGLFLHHCWCDVQMNDYSFKKLNQQMAVVDAAIAKAEGENT